MFCLGYRKSELLSISLLGYVYSFYIRDIFQYVFSLPAMTYYIFLLVIIGTVVVIRKKVTKRIIYFEFLFAITVFMNALIVEYPYYVLLEGIQALLYTSVPIFIFNKDFQLKKFILLWYKFSKYNAILVIFTYYLYTNEIFNYGIFSFLILPNVIAIGLHIILKKIISCTDIIILLLNIFIIIIFGGRTSGMVCLLMIYIAVFNMQNLRSKTIMLLLPLLLFICLFVYIETIVNSLMNFMLSHNLQSRSLHLLANFIDTQEIYLTGRGDIWLLCYEKIIENMGFPGGFGLVLYMTDGKYYYAHNIFLQLFLTFGVFISFYVILLVIHKLRKICMDNDRCLKIFILYLSTTYFFIGLIDSSFWINTFSTLVIASMFFYN